MPPSSRRRTENGGAVRIVNGRSSVAGSDAGTSDGPHPASPSLLHSLKHDKSILSIAISKSSIFAGTEYGEILVFDLETCQKIYAIDAHRGSVLGLFLSQDGKQLFSCASDRFVKTWACNTMSELCSIYPHKEHDIGDIYSVAYASSRNMIYLGTQNASILWYDMTEKDSKPPPSPTTHPYKRQDRFFDSAGPGGVRTPRPEYYDEYPLTTTDTQHLEIDTSAIHHFAHFGYVYCMLVLKGIVSDDPTEEFLISAGGDGSVKVWSINQGENGAVSEMFQLGDADGDSVLSMTLDGSFLITGTVEGRVKVWDLETRQMVRNLRTNIGDVLALSVGGGCLFAAGSKGKVETFNRQYERVSLYTAHVNGRILASGFTCSRDPPIFITGANDNSINIWDVHDCVSSQSPNASPTSNEKLVDKLREFVAFRTVSSLEHCRAECRRGASFLRTLFREMGAISELLPLEDPELNPVVYAEFKGSSSHPGKKKRILFYGHYDVIPAGNEQHSWIMDPFQMEGINEYLYGRGTSDNKGPLVAAVFATADLLKDKTLNADIVFLIEGEEECGSRGFENAIRQWKRKIGSIDWILLANSYWLDDELPCLTYGLRGVIHATVEISSKNPDLHSGVDGSSRGHESMKDLINVLYSVIGTHGEVKMPGFYDQIPPLALEEADHYNRISAALLARNPALGSQERITKDMKQKWREASLTVHGIETSAPSNAAIIPRLAKASISLRLVPHQEASRVADDLIKFFENEFKKLDSSNRIHITIDHKADPWLGDYNNTIYKTLEEGVIAAWPEKFASRKNGMSHKAHRKSMSSGVLLDKPLYIREGGSIPAIRFLEKEFDAPAAHLPCGQASDNAHLDNERLRLVNLYRSREVFKWVFRELPRNTTS